MSTDAIVALFDPIRGQSPFSTWMPHTPRLTLEFGEPTLVRAEAPNGSYNFETLHGSYRLELEACKWSIEPIDTLVLPVRSSQKSDELVDRIERLTWFGDLVEVQADGATLALEFQRLRLLVELVGATADGEPGFTWTTPEGVTVCRQDATLTRGERS